MELKDIQVPDSNYLLSLTKLLSCGIRDIHGYISKEFGDPVFKITKIILQDGKELWVNGEHDIAYIESNDYKNLDFESLSDLHNRLHPK